MEEKKIRYITITLLAVSALQTISSSAISPALRKIMEAFPEVATTTVQLMMTLPSICIIVMSFLVGKLLQKYSLKSLLITGLLLFLAGGFGAIAAPNMPVLLFMRVILGCGLGILTPLLTITVSAYYSGVSRAKMMGYLQSFNFLGGIIGTVFSGMLAASGWRNVFWLYLVCIPGLLLSIFVFPKDAVLQQSSEKGNSSQQAKASFNGMSIFFGVLMFLHAVNFFKASLTMALYLPTIGIESTTVSGIAVGILYAGALCAGLVVVPLGKLVRGAKLPLAFAAEFTFYVILCRTTSLTAVLIACFLLGVGNSIFVATLMSKVPEKVHGPLVPKTITLVNTMIYVGLFLSPYVSAFVKKLGDQTIQFDYKVAAICEAMMFIVTLIWHIKETSSQPKEVS